MNEHATAQTPVRTLDARYYTDPEVFRIEHNGLFARTWQFAGHVSPSNPHCPPSERSYGGHNDLLWKERNSFRL